MNKNLENLVYYVAENNPRGVNKIAYKYGFIPPVSKEGREGLLFTGLMEEGEGFLKAVAKYHPDRDLILSAHNADGSDGAGVEPNVIDLKPETSSIEKNISAIKENSDTLRIAVMLFVAFIIYKILF